jgi:hypothetical protein
MERKRKGKEQEQRGGTITRKRSGKDEECEWKTNKKEEE